MKHPNTEAVRNYCMYKSINYEEFSAQTNIPLSRVHELCTIIDTEDLPTHEEVTKMLHGIDDDELMIELLHYQESELDLDQDYDWDFFYHVWYEGYDQTYQELLTTFERRTL